MDYSWHRYYGYELGRFSQVDRYWAMYPSVSPYVYALNNPLKYTDATGDTVNVSEEMANNEALAAYASTEEGYNYLAQFANEGQTITINGQTFVFKKAGVYSTSNLNFNGVRNTDAGTIPVNSGVVGLVSKFGKQSYEIYISDNSLGNQMDDIFHEVQHASMFESGGFTGFVNPEIAARHHGAMMQGNLWMSHEWFINQSNRYAGVSINAERQYRYLYNQINDINIINMVNNGMPVMY